MPNYKKLALKLFLTLRDTEFASLFGNQHLKIAEITRLGKPGYEPTTGNVFVKAVNDKQTPFEHLQTKCYNQHVNNGGPDGRPTH